MASEASPKEGAQARLLLFVAYRGENYSGFARQTNANTVADELQKAIYSIDPEAGYVTCSSRTDAGVHAHFQPVSFTTTKSVSPRGWVLALGKRLPNDISVVRAALVPMAFDPRRDPVWKQYRYQVFCSPVDDPFISPLAWRVGDALDLALMQKEAKMLVGEHDFAAYRSVDDMRTETTRHLSEVRVEQSPLDPRVLDIHVKGNRFMYNMVRIIAGTLVDIGRGKKEPGACVRAFESKSRRELGVTAPAHGLHLVHVELTELGDDAWPPRPQ